MESSEQAGLPASSSGQPGRFLWRERTILVVILLVAAFARLWRQDLMQFKADEAESCQIAYHVLGDQLRDGDHDFPLVGQMASVGVRNPPFFVYAVALPLAWSRDPIWAARFLALGNIVAVWVCYRVGRRYFSPMVGLAAAALYAVAPAAILYSRSVNAYAAMPLVGGLFLWAVHLFLVDRRPSGLLWMLVLAAIAIQISFAGFIFLPLVLFAMVAGRRAFHGGWFAAGVVASMAMYVPYGLYLVNSGGRDFVRMSEHFGHSANPVSAGLRLLLSGWYSFAASTADTTEFITGVRWPVIFPILLGTGVLGFCGLVYACWQARGKSRPLFPIRLLLVIWFILPFVCLTLTSTMPFRHYFTALYPLPFLGFAILLEKGLQLRRGWGWAVLAPLLACNTWIDVSLYRTLAAQGGAPSPNGYGYDIAYTHKNAAMDFVLAENRNRSFILSSDLDLQSEVPVEYRVLLLQKMRETGWTPATDKPAFGYVFMNTLDNALSERGARAVQGLRQVHFGPLTVYVVPVRN